MIAMGVGNDRPVHRLPGVDVKVSHLTEETPVGKGEERHDGMYDGPALAH
jgi:hypothetical protein